MDLDKDVILLSDGTRLTQEIADEIVDEARQRFGLAVHPGFEQLEGSQEQGLKGNS